MFFARDGCDDAIAATVPGTGPLIQAEHPVVVVDDVLTPPVMSSTVAFYAQDLTSGTSASFLYRRVRTSGRTTPYGLLEAVHGGT